MLPNNLFVTIGIVTSSVLLFSSCEEILSSCQKCEARVEIDSGPVCGRIKITEKGTKFYSFLGIPYAKPPVGHRRFKFPEPPEPWTKPLDATIEGPACPQRNLIYGHMLVEIKGQSEDCLFINVNIPINATLNQRQSNREDGDNTSGLPILFHIPGGGFYCGSGNSDVLGPEYLMEKGFILITFNYRLNVFGFLCMKSKKVPCNRGLWDMLMALKWVHGNARAFGGDPNRITLMGHSAGSASAHLLSLTEQAQGLIQGMILISGTGIPAFYADSSVYAAFTANLLFGYLGLNSTDPDYLYMKLEEMPLTKIMAAHDYVQYQIGITSFVPAMDPKNQNIPGLIPESPITLIRKGRGKNLPTLITFTNNEAAYFKWQLMVLDYLDRIKKSPTSILIPRLSITLSKAEKEEAVSKIYQQYFDNGLTLEKIIEYLGDALFKFPALKLAELRAGLEGGPVYIGQYSYVDTFSPLKYGLWNDHEGASHMEDLTHVFRLNSVLNNYLHLQQSETDHQMTEWLTDFISNFVQCSNPTCKSDDDSPWPPVYPNNYTLQEIARPLVYKTRSLTKEEQEKYELFDAIDPNIKNLTQYLRNKNGL